MHGDDFEYAKQLQNEEVQKNIHSMFRNVAMSEMENSPNNKDARLAKQLQKAELRKQQRVDRTMAQKLDAKDKQHGGVDGAMGCSGQRNSNSSTDNQLEGACYIPSDSVNQAIAQELQLQINSEQDEQDSMLAKCLHEEGCQLDFLDDQQLALQLQEQLTFEQDKQDMVMAQRLQEEENLKKKQQDVIRGQLPGRQHRNHGNQPQHRNSGQLQQTNHGNHQQHGNFDQTLVQRLFNDMDRGRPPNTSRTNMNRSENEGPSLSMPQPNPFWHFEHPGHFFTLPHGNSDQNSFVEFDPFSQAADDDDQYISMTHDPAMLLSLLATRSPEMMVPMDIDLNNYEALWELAENLGEVRNCGASQQEIGQLPVRQYKQSSGASSEAKKCQICLTEFIEGESIRTLPCLHDYHTECIDEWLKRNAICPVCRVSTKVDQNTS